jgi:hypothetical protein
MELAAPGPAILSEGPVILFSWLLTATDPVVPDSWVVLEESAVLVSDDFPEEQTVLFSGVILDESAVCDS